MAFGFLLALSWAVVTLVVVPITHTRPSLPMEKRPAGTTTSDYKRHGTITSDYKRHGTITGFAALDVLTGSSIGSCIDKHRDDEFLKFLRTIDRQVPKTLCGAFDFGQLRHPQAPDSEGIAG